MAEPKKCSQCGATLPPDAPGGHCPQCLLNLAAAPDKGNAKLMATIRVEPLPEDLPPEKTSDRIGHYKLLQQIGEGGMGTVWMAEQSKPVRRKVALKIVKLGMDTKQVVARFEAERQALALMDHPNIAKVLDAGATDSGRPYFVMELVRGIKITDYCDQNNLPTVERLNLFIKVCQAIQHAHQKGIIHRDIKPSNILVTLSDGLPVPKVIDFGIAKAITDQKLTDKTLFTAFEQFIGTPAYMAPEQAEMSALDIDTRSDIYSLGVLLYELLTSKTPFDAKELFEVGLEVMRRVIREQEPPRPSTRLSTMQEGELTTTAKHRQSDPPKLMNYIRGDLDWIVMKCLEKDRTRRYETANGLAMELTRFLNNDPIVARPPSNFYRFQKMVRRNKLVFTASVAIVAVLLLGIIATTWQSVRATRAKREALAAQASESKQREIADAARHQAEDRGKQIEHQLYASEMSRGLSAWKSGDLAGALTALESYQPSPTQEDLRGFEWFYLWRLCHSEQLTLLGHEAKVRAVAFSPDGKWLVSGGDDSMARVWDATTGRQIAVLEGHKGSISTVAYSPDGKFVATGGMDKTVRLWDTVDWKEVALLHGITNGIGALGFSPDGQWLAASSANLVSGGGNPFTRFIDTTPFAADVKVWKVSDQKEIITLPGHKAGVQALAFSPDSKILATASVAGEVVLWNLPDGTRRTNLGPFQVPVLAIGFSHDGSRLVVGGGNPYSRDAMLEILDVDTGKLVVNMKGHRGAVFALAFSPDGRTLATAGMDQTIKIWDLASGTEIRAISGQSSPIWSLAYDPTSKRLASASWDMTVKVWDAEQRQDFLSIPKIPSFSVRFSPDGRYLACGSGHVEVLKIGSKEPAIPLEYSGGGDMQVAWSPDGRLLAAAGMDEVITLWDSTDWHKVGVLKGHTGKIGCLAFSPDGKTLASGAWAPDGTVRSWDLIHMSERWVKWPMSTIIDRLIFTPDSSCVVTYGIDEIIFYDCGTGKEQRRLKGIGPLVAISPDGNWIANAGGHSTSLRLMNLATGEAKWNVTANSDLVYDLAFSPDGKTLTTASWDGTARLWNVASGQEMFRYNTPGVAWSVAFSLDGKYWAVASEPGVTIFHAATPAEVASGGPDTQQPTLDYIPRDDGEGLRNFAIDLQNEGTFAEAEVAYRASLAIKRKALGNEDETVPWTLCGLGYVLQKQGKLVEAESLFREALAIQRNLLNNGNTDVTGSLIDSLNNLVSVLQLQGKTNDAKVFELESMALKKKQQNNQ